MLFNLFGNQFELHLGRPRKNPERDTVVVWSNSGTGWDLGKRLIQKEVNKDCLRRFARHPICRRAIQIKKNGLLNLPWAIEKINLFDKYDYKSEIACLTKCFMKPNNGDTFNSLIGAVVEDIETGDCGAIEVVASGDYTRPVQLFPVDGFTIDINAEWNNDPKEPRYYQKYQDKGTHIELLDEDLIFLNNTSYTYTPMGYSPIESAFILLNYLLNSQEYAGMVTSNAIPKFILNLGKTIDENKINTFRKYFEEEIYGSGRIPIIGGSEGIQTHQLTAINDEGLYLQWQHFLITIIAYTFGIDPKRFNEGSQTDRSTVDEQKENINDEAIRPLARLIEEGFNNKVVARCGLGDRLQFKFHFEDTESRKMDKAKRIILLHNDDLITLNQSLELLNLPKSNSKYKDMLKSEFKAAVNQDYQVAGGFNGVGQDRYSNNSDTATKGGDNTDEKTK